MASGTNAKTRGHKVDTTKGGIRAPRASGKQGTGFSASRVRRGAIRTSNTYSG